MKQPLFAGLSRHLSFCASATASMEKPARKRPPPTASVQRKPGPGGEPLSQRVEERVRNTQSACMSQKTR